MNEISLDQFEDWFVPYSLNIHKQGDEAGRNLAYAINHKLDEYDEDSDQLRAALLKVMFPVSISVNQSGEIPQEGSNLAAAFNEVCVA